MKASADGKIITKMLCTCRTHGILCLLFCK